MKTDLTNQLNLEHWVTQLNETFDFIDSRHDVDGPIQMITFQWDSITCNQFHNISSGKSGNAYCLCMSAFVILLNKLNLDRPLITAIPIKATPNTNVIFFKPVIDENTTAMNITVSIREQLMQGLNYIPYDEQALVNSLRLMNTLSDDPVYRTGFGLEGFTLADDSYFQKFDFTIFVSGSGSKLMHTIYFKKNSFKTEFVETLASAYHEVVKSILTDMNRTVKSVCLISDKERLMVEAAYNKTETPLSNETLVSLFEQQCHQSGDDVAIVHNDKGVTYRELHDRVTTVASVLHTQYDLQSGDIAAMMMDRSEAMIISIFAILKCGAAYLPIDAETPEARVKFILQDSMAKVMVSDTKDIAGIPTLKVADLLHKKPQRDDQAVFNRVTSECLAYVIFTSGSTGVPKGVMVDHAGAVNRIEWMWKHYGFEKADIVLQKTTYTFDVSVWEIFMTLCFGARLVLCDKQDVLDPKKIAKLIFAQKITTLHFVPSVLEIFLNGIDKGDEEKMASLNKVFTSGESLLSHVTTVYFKKIKAQLHNLYGPTEASVDVSYYPVSEQDSQIPIGRPISNMRIHVLDRHKQQLAYELEGEIALAGVGLARGYLNRVELTNERFYHHNFLGRVYLTGDIGSLSHDNQLHYITRKDNQVKVNGHRIELGEIENTLAKFPGVKSAVVGVDRRDFNSPLLIAFIVMQNTEYVNDTLIKEHVGRFLPQYMVPQYIVQVSNIPLTSSGKSNVKQLLAEFDLSTVSRSIINKGKEPLNEMEQELYQIWRSLLNHSNFFRDDDFFKVGGTSLKVIDLRNRIVATFGEGIEPYHLFIHNTIAKQGMFLSGNAAATNTEQKTNEIEI